MSIIKEACVGNYIEAKKAYENGAHRIELCDNLGEGGTTHLMAQFLAVEL